jgi:hypothetical protein
MVIFHSYVAVYQRVSIHEHALPIVMGDSTLEDHQKTDRLCGLVHQAWGL